MASIKIPLYKAHDYDLVCLYLSIGPKAFARVVHEVLRCYTEGIPYNPKGLNISVRPPVGEKGAAVTCRLTIDSRMEKEAGLLGNVIESKRAAFIKVLLRAYLIQVLAPAYLKKAEGLPSVETDDPGNENLPNITRGNTRSRGLKTRVRQTETQEAETAPKDLTKLQESEDDMGALADLFNGIV